MIKANGIDRLLQGATANGPYAGFRDMEWGLVSNNAAITLTGSLNRIELLRQGWKVRQLFSPEHGLSSQAADGEKQGNETDRLTGLPVYSLYGEHFAPPPSLLDPLDGILFDIPDAGCRFYTFLWTLSHVMEACAAAGKPLLVLDRPNPTGLGTSLSEGPLLDETNCSSFIGRWSIPIRHSATLGELARYFRNTRMPQLDLTVIPCEAPSLLPVTDPVSCNWLPPSPGIPEPQTALLYPGMGLLEGLNINEGRGTTLPFRVFGAPFLDNRSLAEAIGEMDIPGLKAIPCSYQPAWGEWAGEWCQGIQWLVREPARVQPVATLFRVIRHLLLEYPEQVEPRLYKTNANPGGQGHLDRLTGIKDSLELIKSGGIFSHTGSAADWTAGFASSMIYHRDPDRPSN